MQQNTWKPAILALAALALCAVAPTALIAQDRQDDHHEQKPAEHNDAHPAARNDDHHDAHPAMRSDEHHDNDRPDPAAQYRHDHPRSSARCHDGFFTSTSDRSRACSKHGGIDVWLVL
jgi:hypothetical protein